MQQGAQIFASDWQQTNVRGPSCDLRFVPLKQWQSRRPHAGWHWPSEVGRCGARISEIQLWEARGDYLGGAVDGLHYRRPTRRSSYVQRSAGRGSDCISDIGLKRLCPRQAVQARAPEGMCNATSPKEATISRVSRMNRRLAPHTIQVSAIAKRLRSGGYLNSRIACLA